LPRLGALAAAFVVVLLAAGAYAWRAGYAPRFMAASVDDRLANAPRLSIVVLPFENLSGDKEQDYFADGITDDLTTDLSHLPDSFVIGRGSAFTYKGKPVDAKKIGRELGVRYVLEGSVRRLGEAITLNAQLISTETGAHVWADRFDGERSRLGQLQVEFVSRLANSLGVELVKAEALRAAHERPNNPDAVDLAMRGLAAYYQAWGLAGENEAIGYFERALQLDPGHTAAKISLAQALIDRFMWFGGGDEAVDVPRAEALVASALSAEPNNPRAHLAKMWTLAAKKQFNGQFAEVDAAIENNRNYAEAYANRGVVLTFAGRAAETIAEEETALRLSPRDPGRSNWEYNICHAHAHLAQWEKAIEWCQKSITTSAENWFPYVDLAAASAWLGHDAEAKAAITGLVKAYPGLTVHRYADMGARVTYNPTFAQQFQRIVEGLRKAGLPEGEKTTD
jgi:TolB-like protein